MDIAKLEVFLLAGLSQASILFLVAAGLSLVFGALRVINMAHGSLYMIGAFVTTAVVLSIGAAFGFWAALIAAPIAVALIGGLIEIVVLRRVYGREHLLQLLATYALTLVFAGGVRTVFGSENRSISMPPVLEGAVHLGAQSIPVYRLFLMVAALVVAGALYVMLYRTGLGRQVRAAATDPDLVRACGIDVSRLFTVVFMIGALLAGLGGALIAPGQAVTPAMDTDVLVEAFAISVIGGLGSLVGSLVGSVLVGLLISLGIMFPLTSRWSLAFIFVAMVAVLTVRPWGLFGKPE